MITKQQAEKEFGIVDGQKVTTFVFITAENWMMEEAEYTERVTAGGFGKRELNKFNKVGFVPTHTSTVTLTVETQGRFNTPNGWRVMTSLPVIAKL